MINKNPKLNITTEMRKYKVAIIILMIIIGITYNYKHENDSKYYFENNDVIIDIIAIDFNYRSIIVNNTFYVGSSFLDLTNKVSLNHTIYNNSYETFDINENIKYDKENISINSVTFSYYIQLANGFNITRNISYISYYDLIHIRLSVVMERI